MLIECKIKRANGTKALMQGVVYHFKPDEQGRHVCEIENLDHADAFLAVAGVYTVARRARAERDEKPKQAETTENEQADGSQDAQGGAEDQQDAPKPATRRGRKPKDE